jgi:hypothetical protein
MGKQGSEREQHRELESRKAAQVAARPELAEGRKPWVQVEK